MHCTTGRCRESLESAHRVWLQHSEHLVAVVDPGSGELAVVPGALASGPLVWWQGKLRTQQGLALEYAVALEEALRDQGIRGVLTACGQRLGSVTGRVYRLDAAEAEVSISLHFLSSFHRRDRGFAVTAGGDRALPFAWGLWSELCRYLPCQSEPWVDTPAGSLPRSGGGLAVHIGLGHITSSLDMRLIMEPYWKLRVTEGLAGVMERYLSVEDK